MKSLNRHFYVSLVLVALVLASPAVASENLLRNAGFEQGAPDDVIPHWNIELKGEWTAEWKIPTPLIVKVTTDARTGKGALEIDTTIINPSGKITDELRTWKYPKYEIYVTQSVRNIKPNAWYLVKFRIKSPGIAIDEGMQLLADIKPWPATINRLESFSKKLHWGKRMVEGRIFQPRVPKTDGEYHEYVMLKQTYDQTDSLDIGIRLRAPWTGKVIIDDIELIEVDPDKDLTPMEKLLAIRAAKPITKVRELNRETPVAADGQAKAAILAPTKGDLTDQARQIQAKVRELTGAELPIVTDLADVPAGMQIIALGNLMQNDLVARMHFNRYVKINAAAPGPGGYVVWSVCEPYGLAKKQNVIVVAGSDEAGQKAACESFLKTLAASASDNSLELAFLHEVAPHRKLTEEQLKEPLRSWGYGDNRQPMAVFSKFYHNLWLETGDLDIVKRARNQLFRVMGLYFEKPYKKTAWDSFEVGFAWDCMEEIPGLTDADRLKMTNFFQAYLHLRTIAASDWRYMVPRLNNANPTWNHQAKGLAAAYTMGRYFARYYGDHDARFDYYAKTAASVFKLQSQWYKPEENSGNYTQITMKFAISYYLGEWDLEFFRNGSARQFAEFTALTCNNQGHSAGYGDTYYLYDGWKSNHGFREYELPIALWFTQDGRLLWWMQHVRGDYRSPYHQDVQPVEWTELLGLHKMPLVRGLYDTRTRVPLWGADGEGAEQPSDGVAFAETFDKISFRENWDADGQYLLLEGMGRGIHSGRATNQICKLTTDGEDLLIGSTYRGTGVRNNCTVIVVKDADINDEKAVGKAGMGYGKWSPIRWQYPSYAALEAMGELPNAGLTRSSMRNFLGGTTWHRNIFWAKGKYFVVLDEVVADEAGEYYIEANLRTCPNSKKGSRWVKITKRTGKVLPGDRGYQIDYQRDDKLQHYLLTDGTATIVADPAPAKDITTIMLRQVHKAIPLAAGGKVTFMTLMYGDQADARANYRLERISDTEGLIFADDKPVAYFGSAQSPETAAILPITAKMFFLADGNLSVADATAVNGYLSSDKPTTREIELLEAEKILAALAKLVKK